MYRYLIISYKYLKTYSRKQSKEIQKSFWWSSHWKNRQFHIHQKSKAAKRGTLLVVCHDSNVQWPGYLILGFRLTAGT